MTSAESPSNHLVCERCGSARLHRSRMKAPSERLLKLTSTVRAWRCDECGTRQLSERRPLKRAQSGETPKAASPAETQKPEALARTATPESPARPRKKKRDPLAEKIRARRRKRTLLTVLLIIVTGLIAAWLVIRSHQPSTAEVTEIN